jgi:ATP-dependent helicase HrpB
MLPVHEILPQLKHALAAREAAVLVAAPGAGKTTVVPLALMDEPWAAGRILVLEPRRIAARAAAGHMARTLGERAGETVGYRVRMDSRVTARTRVELVTEGVFTRMILDDPGLEGVSAVIFDEFHERSIDGDLGLALARDAQRLLRPDLRILVMSATIDGARIASLLGGAPVIESAGRQYPVSTRYLGRGGDAPLQERVGRAVMRALAEEAGSLLVFLPGQGEIRRVEQWLAERITLPGVEVTPLYGAMDPSAQDRAIAPSPPGGRKVVLASAVAETSLTIEGVSIVIDSGLARVPRFDPGSGLTRLETVRVTLASAEQRRGRAGRTGPGVCYRLWDEQESRSLVPHGQPEILETDLAGLVLDLARWGARDATGLAFLDPPPPTAFGEARHLLMRLEALDAEGALTAEGRRMADLPLPPRLAHMVLKGAQAGAADVAGRIAILLTERGLGGADTHLEHRLEAFGRDRSARARDARALAQRWAAAAGGRSGDGIDPARLLAEAYPERIARRRGKPGEFQLVTGRGVYVDPTDSLARHDWLAVGELGGGEARDRILLAAPLDEGLLKAAFSDRMTTEDLVESNSAGRLQATRRTRLGALIIETRRIDRPDAQVIARHLTDQVRSAGVEALPWSQASKGLRSRVAFLRLQFGADWPDFSDAALTMAVDQWLAPLLTGASTLAEISSQALADALRGLIGWERLRQLDQLAPETFVTPAGPAHPIDYAAEGGPRVQVRVGELYGLSSHPTVAGGRVPLTLALLSPARREIQVTRDLAGFWHGSWKEVRREMKGRYPKHVWPEEPWATSPTTRAKPRP